MISLAQISSQEYCSTYITKSFRGVFSVLAAELNLRRAAEASDRAAANKRERNAETCD